MWRHGHVRWHCVFCMKYKLRTIHGDCPSDGGLSGCCQKQIKLKALSFLIIVWTRSKAQQVFFRIPFIGLSFFNSNMALKAIDMAAFVPGTQVIFSKSMFPPFLSKPGCPGKFPKLAFLLNCSLFPEQKIHHLLSHPALSHPTLNHHFITSFLHKTSFLLSKIPTHGFTLQLPPSTRSLTHDTGIVIPPTMPSGAH